MANWFRKGWRGREEDIIPRWFETRLHFSGRSGRVVARFHRRLVPRSGKYAAVHVGIDVLENVAVFTVPVSRSSSSCGSERAGHSTASSRSPGFCRCATRVFRSALLWRQPRPGKSAVHYTQLDARVAPRYVRQTVLLLLLPFPSSLSFSLPSFLPPRLASLCTTYLQVDPSSLSLSLPPPFLPPFPVSLPPPILSPPYFSSQLEKTEPSCRAFVSSLLLPLSLFFLPPPPPHFPSGVPFLSLAALKIHHSCLHYCLSSLARGTAHSPVSFPPSSISNGKKGCIKHGCKDRCKCNYG